MQEPAQRHPTSTSEVPAGDGRLLAHVRIAEASASQVRPSDGRDALVARLHAIKGLDLEIVGPTFLPKGCRLAIDVQRTSGQRVALAGAVRRTQMLSTVPSYASWVRLDEGAAELLARLQPECEASRVAAPEPAGDTFLGAGSVPGWAARLVDEGELGDQALAEVVAQAASEGVGLDQALVRAGLVLEEKVARCVAMDLSVPFVDPRAYDIRLENEARVPEELARRHRLFPLFELDGVITLGMSDPTDLAVIDQVRLRAGCQVDQCLAPQSALDALIARAYRPKGEPAAPASVRSEAHEDDATSNNAVVRLVRTIVEDAARDGVSDVHIEPERDELRVRIRVDGVLRRRSVHPLAMHAPIVSRIKVVARLDIAESRRPQDGHFAQQVGTTTVDVRVSTIPTVHGENVVLRLLPSDGESIALEQLGMPAPALERMQGFLEHPNGMILVTGPTGSGKTTTLYAALARLNTVQRNVVTVEDPVEKRIPLLRQTEINPKAGLTFASGLRSILRQDPDVIMVGEIRDRETAEIAVQAALTGHLVLSTLHTNTAAGAIVRLSEIGVPPFLITSSLRAVVSQRLARRVCERCRTPRDPDQQLVAGLRMADAGRATFFAGAGCTSCLSTGYKGRVGLYEMLEPTPELGSALLGNAPRDAIERAAERALVSDMLQDGLDKVRAGATTLEEVARIVGVRHPGGRG